MENSIKCNNKLNATAIYLVDYKDVKVMNETEFTLKRKYGKFKREVFRYELKDNLHCK